jgi:hypothetical protein
MIDQPKEMPQRAALLSVIRDMLDDPIGQDFIAMAVHLYSLELVRHEERLDKSSGAIRKMKEKHLSFAHLILDDVSPPPF